MPKPETESASVAIRDAATIILIRDRETEPSVLMGQRGRNAIFMPKKFVFPGGATDPGDSGITLATSLPEICRAKLAQSNIGAYPEALAVTAIRELWEETGLVIGAASDWPDAPPGWEEFAKKGYRPAASALRFVFRAVTPPGRPRRFDARFFLADADALVDEPDSIPDATDELSYLQWVPLKDVRTFDLAFVTQLVLAEVSNRLPDLAPPSKVPFVRNDSLSNDVVWL